MEARKPVAALVKGDLLVVVCDDGSVWHTDHVESGRGWIEHPPIPGSRAAVEDQN